MMAALGQGIPININEADELFRKVATQWSSVHLDAINAGNIAYEIGNIYYEMNKRASGILPDANNRALSWYRRAAEAGNDKASATLARLQAETTARLDPNDIVAAVLNFTSLGNDNGQNGRFWFKDPNGKCRYLLHKNPTVRTSDDALALIRSQLGMAATLDQSGAIDLDTLDPKNIKFDFDGVNTITQHMNQTLFIYVGRLDAARLQRGWTLIYTKFCTGKESPF
jgi:TPR repeat protein